MQPQKLKRKKLADLVLCCIENLVRFHFKQSRNEGEAGVNAKVFHTLPLERKNIEKSCAQLRF